MPRRNCLRRNFLTPARRTRRQWKKILREVHRLQGLLRFRPEADGPGERYTARCAPDYFVLPLLADHFAARFGETPWTIIDEKRRLALVRDRGRPPELRPWRKTPVPAGGTADAAADSPALSGGEKNSRPWEELWKHYHRAAANEARTNPGLQRQFMPKRYWKYLPEME